jgi:hypothetical protein
VKTVSIPPHATEVHALLEQARREDVLVQAADGSEFVLTAVDEFDREIATLRQNTELMKLLDERAEQTETIPLDEVKRQLGLSE